jgi:hypothetical protein
MIVRCPTCQTYDDAARLTYWDQFISSDDLLQKDAALALLGKPVCFAHQPDGPAHRVQSIGWNGMVTLNDMVGEFAPHLFVAT